MMKKPMKPGDMFNAAKAKMKRKKKMAPTLSSSHNPGSMPGMTKPQVDRNPNSPANYGKAMSASMRNTKVFGMPGMKKRAKRGGNDHDADDKKRGKKMKRMACKRHKRMACKRCG